MEDDTLWCEQCGEAEQEVHLSEAGLCGDCSRQIFSEILEPLLWSKPCGQPLFNREGQMVAICVIPHGTEHREMFI